MMKLLVLAVIVSGAVLEVKTESCLSYQEGYYYPVSGSGCTQFRRCVNGEYTSPAWDCPAGTLYNVFISVCDNEANVNVTFCEPFQNLGTGIGYPLTRKELCFQVKKIMDVDGRKTPFKENLPGRGWFDAFKSRNPEFSERTPATLGHQRSMISEEMIKECTGVDMTKAITVPGDCSKYYYCTYNAGMSGYQDTAAKEYSCWGSTLFNLDVQLCVQANQVDVATCTTA